MELQFDYAQQVALGSNPGAVEFPDQTSQVFYTGEGGRMMGITTSEPNGEWGDREFSSPLVVAHDLNIMYLTLRRISRYGLYGSWHSDNIHRFAIYGVDFDVSDYIEDGSLEFIINNSIASMSLTLDNPSKVFMDEEQSMLTPGAKVQLSFRVGDSIPYPMGTFFVDRGSFGVVDSTIQTSGRNLTGKILKDQTFDETNEYPYQLMNTLLDTFFKNAGLQPAQYFIENTEAMRGIKFPSNMSFHDGLQALVQTLTDWRIQELLDGTIAVGTKNYEKFDQPSKYTFYRNRDIWSRQITRDDMDTYRRVCVHTSDFSIKVYKDVTIWQGWGLGAKKTFYVQVPDGTTQADAQTSADELAQRLSSVGVIESFAGPFRPHIQPGDEAEIIGEDGRSRILGLITVVKHSFGKQGFATEFTVDSGGQLGKGRITDFIEKLNRKQSVSNVTRLY